MDGGAAEGGERQPVEPDAAPAPAASAGWRRDPASSSTVRDQNPKKSAGRLGGARGVVTAAAYRAPRRPGRADRPLGRPRPALGRGCRPGLPSG